MEHRAAASGPHAPRSTGGDLGQKRVEGDLGQENVGGDLGQEYVHGNAAPRAQIAVDTAVRGDRDAGGGKSAGVAGGRASSASAADVCKVGLDVESISDSEEDADKEEELFAGNLLGKRSGAPTAVGAAARTRY